jgi:hypothetical protein
MPVEGWPVDLPDRFIDDRPELIALDPTARERVSAQIAAKGGYRECCGAKDFDVGDALFLGFPFLDEDTDAYMVAPTCRNPDCAKAADRNRVAAEGFP